MRAEIPSRYDKRRIGVVRSTEDWQGGFLEVLYNFSKDLSLSKKDIDDTIDLGFRYYATGKSKSTNRFVVVAGAIYVATALNGDRRSQERISEVLGITTVSLRKCYRDICDKLLIPYKEEEDG